MTDWLSSMQQTFEYYIVDPKTWMDKKKIDNVRNCTINNDLEADTLGSASIDLNESQFMSLNTIFNSASRASIMLC